MVFQYPFKRKLVRIIERNEIHHSTKNNLNYSLRIRKMFHLKQFGTPKSYQLLEKKCLEMKEFQTTEANKVPHIKFLLDPAICFLSDGNIGNTAKLQRYHFRNQNILPQKVRLNIN